MRAAYYVLLLAIGTFTGGYGTATLASLEQQRRERHRLEALADKWERMADACDRAAVPDAADALRRCAVEILTR